jgi:uncharacterized protein (DUF1499 family)
MPLTRRAPVRAATVTVSALLLGACWAGVPDTIGARTDGLAPCPSTPNCVHTGMRHPRGTKGLFARGDIGRRYLMPRIREVVESMPRSTVVTVTDQYLHAEFRSRIFRFVDDLEILIAPNRELLVRSASRVGSGDMGVNAARVEELRRLLTEAEILR